VWEAKGKDNFYFRVGVRSTLSRGLNRTMTRRCNQNMGRYKRQRGDELDLGKLGGKQF
jgi:hypothetical protein